MIRNDDNNTGRISGTDRFNRIIADCAGLASTEGGFSVISRLLSAEGLAIVKLFSEQDELAQETEDADAGTENTGESSGYDDPQSWSAEKMKDIIDRVRRGERISV